MTSMTIVGYGFMDLVLYDRNIVDDFNDFAENEWGFRESGVKEAKKNK